MAQIKLQNVVSEHRRLDGKIALVTGGSQGIGKAVARILVVQGAKVIITYSTNIAAASDTVQEIDACNVVAIKSDAGSIEDIDKLLKKIVLDYGHLDILIANAAKSPAERLEETTESSFDAVMGTNVKGPFFLVQKAVPLMPAGSKVILVSSSLCNTSQVMPEKLLYCISKGAVEQMTRVMAKELAKRQVAINCIAPGPTATEAFYDGKSEQLIKLVAGFSPYCRIGTPEETAAVFLFLCTDDSSWMTGQVLRVNGGSS